MKVKLRVHLHLYKDILSVGLTSNTNINPTIL